MTLQTVPIPDLGDAEDVEVAELCVAVGDEVQAQQSLAVLESDKAALEVETPVAGRVTAIHLKEGQKVAQGDAIADIEVAAEAQAQEELPPAAAAAPADEAPPAAAAAPADEAPPAAIAAPAPMTLQTVPIPDLGGAEDVEVAELCVAVGDEVQAQQSLAVLESDKAALEVETPVAGRVTAIHLKEGQKVAQGDAIADIEVAAQAQARDEPPPAAVAAPAPAAAADKSPPSPAPAVPPASAAAPPAATPPSPGGAVHAGPAVRKLAREFGIDLSRVAATGLHDRIIKEDLQRHVREALDKPAPQAQLPTVPTVDFAAFGATDTQKMSRSQRATAAGMRRSWLNIPHVTQFDEADVTALEELRKQLRPQMEQRGCKLTPLVFLLRACVQALEQHPKFNASLHADGEQIISKRYINIGIAVDTPRGLTVPVLRDAAKRDLWETGAELAALAARARDGKLKPKDLQGGSFTISSLGAIGGTGFTPIVNAPEVAILGVSRLAIKPVFCEDAFQPRKMLPLCLSYDHRVVNGADAGRFMTALCTALATPETLLDEKRRS